MAESNLLMKTLTNSYNTKGQWLVTDIPNHHHIHEGEFFSAFKTTSSIGASSWIDIEIVTPSSAYAQIHLKELAINHSAGLCTIYLYEPNSTNGSTHTNGGTTQAYINHFRGSTKTSYTGLATAVSNLPSATTVTSTQYKLLLNEYIGSSGTAAARGSVGVFDPRNEIVLKFSTTYVLRLLDGSGAAGASSLKMFWYESTQVF